MWNGVLLYTYEVVLCMNFGINWNFSYKTFNMNFVINWNFSYNKSYSINFVINWNFSYNKRYSINFVINRNFSYNKSYNMNFVINLLAITKPYTAWTPWNNNRLPNSSLSIIWHTTANSVACIITMMYKLAMLIFHIYIEELSVSSMQHTDWQNLYDDLGTVAFYMNKWRLIGRNVNVNSKMM